MQKIVNLSDECVPQTKLYLYHFDTIELSSGNGPHFQPLSMSLTEKWKMVLVLFCFILFCGVCFVSVLETLETRLEKASGKRAFSDKDEGYYSTISENYVPKSMIYIWTERVGKKIGRNSDSEQINALALFLVEAENLWKWQERYLRSLFHSSSMF